MIYQVKAKFNYDKAREFYRKITDGTVADQEPDGQEIVNSMNRATTDDSGEVSWTELCFCPTPLQHERTTLYDNYFTDMKIEPVSNHRTIGGRSFMASISPL